MKTSSGLPLILHYDEWYNYFIIYYNVIIEIKCTINVIRLNHPKTIPPLVRGKIVFHKTGPWCQKGWGRLPYMTVKTQESGFIPLVGFLVCITTLDSYFCFDFDSLNISFPVGSGF